MNENHYNRSNFKNQTLNKSESDPFKKWSSEPSLPLTIRALNRIINSGPVNGLYYVDGCEIIKLQIIGRICKIENDPNRIRLFIDDGTGVYELSGSKQEGLQIPKLFSRIPIE